MKRLAGLLPEGAKFLDVGYGGGSIDRLIGQYRPDARIAGIDLVVRTDPV